MRTFPVAPAEFYATRSGQAIQCEVFLAELYRRMTTLPEQPADEVPAHVAAKAMEGRAR